MGGNSTTSPIAQFYMQQAQTAQLPGTLQAISNATPGMAQNTLQAAQQTQPGYDALNLSEAQRYALPLAQVGQDVTRSNALAGAGTNLAQLQGAGGDAASAAVALNNRLNPVQAASNTQATNLINSINLNGLSGGEQAAVERSLNQSNFASGNLGIDNATNAVSNAMNFGNALQAKRAALGNALQTGTQVASAQNQQVNPVNVALGQPNQSTGGNFGTGTFTNSNAQTQSGAGNGALGAGASILGSWQGGNNAITSGSFGLAGTNSTSSYIPNISV